MSDRAMSAGEMRRYYQIEFALEVMGVVLLAGLIWAGVQGGALIALRAFLGAAYLLFLPGYTLQNLLFPRQGSLDRFEQVGLSFSLSVALIGLTALLLEYVLGGFRIWTVFWLQASLVIGFSLLAYLRRSRIPHETWQTPLFLFPHLSISPQNRKALIWGGAAFGTIFLAVIALATIPDPKDYYTEFFILGSDMQVQYYPREVTVGQPITVTMGIVSHENKGSVYRVHLKLAERTEPLSAEIALQPGQSWQEAVEYTLDQVGADQRVEFWLERKGTELPYRKLWLWVNVRAAEAP